MSGKKEKITVLAKATRYRKSNWTEEEVTELCNIWMKPEIINGLSVGHGHGKKQETFKRISDELSKVGSERNVVECQHKLKNLRRLFRSKKADGTLDSWRFKDVMEKILRLETVMSLESCSQVQQDSSNNRNETEDELVDFSFDLSEENDRLTGDGISAGKQNITMSTENQFDGLMSHPVEIEFELMDLVKGQMPIEIEGGSIVVPQEFANDVGILDSCTPQALPHVENVNCLGPSPSNNLKRCMNSQEILQKRKKLQTLSEKMTESVSRILNKSTNLFIEEIKKSEERFIKFEEERREKDRKHEEAMLQKLLGAFKKGRNGGLAHQAQNVGNSNEDPPAASFERLATTLMTTVTEKTRELDKSLIEWETRMQQQETSHTENLFNMILSAVTSSSQ